MMQATEVDELKARAMAARYGDLAAYAKAVHDLQFETYQDAWAMALETLDRVVIICPPDTYKSTTVRMFSERMIGKNPNIRILWLMGTGAQAEKQVMDVASTITGNRIYREAFGIESDPEGQWTNTVLFVKRDRFGPDPTLMATGIDGPYQGLHFDMIVIDDPTTPKDVRSPTEMESQKFMVRGMILDRLVEGGRIVVILTRWGENDLVPTFQEMGFTLITMPVVAKYPWGPTLSPKRFPPDRIEQIRADKSDPIFNLTFMCSPESLEGGLIQRKNIKYWDKDNLPDSPLQCFMGVDPAASLKTYADYSCMATIGLDTKTRKKYLLDLWTARVEVPDLERELVRRAKKVAGLRAVGLETVGFQLSLMQSLKRKNVLPLVEIPYRSRRQVMHKVRGMDRDKVGRALYLNAEFSAGRFLIPRELPLVEGISLEAELCTIPFSKHDDRLDAIVIANTLADSAMPARGMKVKMTGF